MRKFAILLLLVFCSLLFSLVGCSNNHNDSNSQNIGSGDGQTIDDNSSNLRDDDSFINIKMFANAIRQENKGNEINIIRENEKEKIALDELFSYSQNYMVEIYSLTDSIIDYSKKEISLNVGYNNFQILFKNLSNYSEKFYDVKFFRDPGTISRKVDRYSIQKEYTQSTNENGLPEYDFKFYIQEDLGDYLIISGEKIPAKVVKCNIGIVYQAYFYVDENKFLPSSNFPHQYTESFSISYTFINPKEVFETIMPFPQYFWEDCCSNSSFLTLDNSHQGICERDIYVYTNSYILLGVDYSKYQFN